VHLLGIALAIVAGTAWVLSREFDTIRFDTRILALIFCGDGLLASGSALAQQ